MSRGGKPVVYFAYQTAVAVLELAVLRWKLYRLLPEETGAHPTLWNWTVLKPGPGFLRKHRLHELDLGPGDPSWTSSCFPNTCPCPNSATSPSRWWSRPAFPSFPGPSARRSCRGLTRLVASGDEPGMIQLYRGRDPDGRRPGPPGRGAAFLFRPRGPLRLDRESADRPQGGCHPPPLCHRERDSRHPGLPVLPAVRQGQPPAPCPWQPDPGGHSRAFRGSSRPSATVPWEPGRSGPP